MSSRSARWMTLAIVAISALVVPAGTAGAGNNGAPDAEQPLYWHIEPDGAGGVEVGQAVHNSSAAIWRDEDGISFRIRTTGLTKDHAYTVWFFSYDAPENCRTGDGNEGTRCTGNDFLNPASLPSIMWGTGKFVKSNGLVTFTGRRESPSSPCITEPAVVDEKCSGVLLGHGLHDPLGAEIHFVLRDHGPDQEGIEDETTTINGGCDPLTHVGLPVFGPGWGTPGNYPCVDPQGNN